MDEAGVPGFEVTPWFGILAPAGTPPRLISSLYQKISGIAKQGEVQTALATQGFESVGNTPDEFRDLIKLEIGKWEKVVTQTGAQVE
jgi:tripartite-type tricarboxylate transporter receptor subunit TctC